MQERNTARSRVIQTTDLLEVPNFLAPAADELLEYRELKHAITRHGYDAVVDKQANIMTRFVVVVG